MRSGWSWLVKSFPTINLSDDINFQVSKKEFKKHNLELNKHPEAIDVLWALKKENKRRSIHLKRACDKLHFLLLRQATKRNSSLIRYTINKGGKHMRNCGDTLRSSHYFNSVNLSTHSKTYFVSSKYSRICLDAHLKKFKSDS